MIEAHALSRYYRRTQPQLQRWAAPSTAALAAALQAARQHSPNQQASSSEYAPVLSAMLQEACAQHPLPAALRISRQALMCTLIEHDCASAYSQAVALDATTAVLSQFAEACCELANAAACADQAKYMAMPLSAANEQGLLITGMGKLGAGELNASSDIDLVYLHEAEGNHSHDDEAMSAHEWFSRAARRCSQLLADVTEHGFVFRVDTRLRPNGDEGPGVCSFEMLEQYLTEQGRPWERFAWLRARILGKSAQSANIKREWQNTVQPFVFRRYADFGMIDSLRALHAQIRADAKARATRNPAASGDVKRSRGGIRELEFFVQLLQLVRGGVAPELRERHTRKALALLAKAGMVEAPRAQALDEAYTFLRALENRIQYLDDAQTHYLPTDDADLEHLAQAMGLGSGCKLLCQLDEHREQVANAFDGLLLTLGEQSQPRAAASGCSGCQSAEKGAVDLLTNTYTPDTHPSIIHINKGDIDNTNNNITTETLSEIQASVVQFKVQPALQRLTADTQAKLLRIVSRSQAAFMQSQAAPQSQGAIAYSMTAWRAWLEWLGLHAGRSSYLAFFDEHPQAAERLLRLLSVCAFAAQYVRRFPGVVDELLSPQATARFDAASYTAMLRTRLAAIEQNHGSDVEAQLDALRRAHQLETFRLVLRDTELHPAVEVMSDDITALADATLQVSLEACWQGFAAKTRDAPQFAVIGYGKLGSKELGYLSDLDLVLIYDDRAGADEGVMYTQFAKRWINWLTTHTGSGRLFDIDTRLRPNGNAGLLVTSLSAFELYQLGRGGNTAWTWEHQALTKARPVAGSPQMAQAFDKIRSQVLQSPRDARALAAEIKLMRDKMHAAHPTQPGWFDVKHDSGGLIDAEFAVQYLVLAHAHQHPGLTANSGTIALLGVAAQLGLIGAARAQDAQDAYRTLRAEQHRLKLAGHESARVADTQYQTQRNHITALSNECLSTSGASQR